YPNPAAVMHNWGFGTPQGAYDSACGLARNARDQEDDDVEMCMKVVEQMCNKLHPDDRARFLGHLAALVHGESGGADAFGGFRRSRVAQDSRSSAQRHADAQSFAARFPDAAKVRVM